MKPEKKKMTLPDCQGEKDYRKIDIDRVGIKDLRYPIRVKDRSNEFQHTVGTVTMTVDLPRHFKGTHMSRFVEILNSHGREVHVENILAILSVLKKRLSSDAAHLTIEFPYFIEKKAPTTKAKGLVDYIGRFEASIENDKEDFILTVIVPVTTLCPCSKAISIHGAHNQRGYVTLSVRSQEMVWMEEIIEIVESSASSEIFSLLKRPDEKNVTERAYENPVFVEDLIREIALKLNDHKAITWYRVEAENMESIHNHSAYGCIEKSKVFG